MEQLADVDGLVPDHLEVVGDLLGVLAELALEVVRIDLLILADDVLVLQEIANELLTAVLEQVAYDIQQLQGSVNELRLVLEILEPVNEQVEYLGVLLSVRGGLGDLLVVQIAYLQLGAVEQLQEKGLPPQLG